MTNPSPLEKQLLHMELSKGINERDRPETSEAATCLTRVHNLVQNQTGSWVKRPGTTLIGGSLADDDGDNLLPSKLLRLKEGLGMLDSRGALLHYQEGIGTFVKRNNFPDYVATKVDTIASSGAAGVPEIYGVATCTKFHAILDNGTEGLTLSIYDREASVVVGRYAVGNATWRGVQAMMAFVADRYLHVYFTRSSDGLWGDVIDTDVKMPLVSALNPTHLITDNVPSFVYDIAVHTDRSFIAHGGTVYSLVSMGNDRAIIDNVVVASASRISNSGDKLWRMDPTELEALDPEDLTTALVASAGHGATVGDPPLTSAATVTSTIVATPDNYVYVVVQTPGVTFGGSTLYTIGVMRTTAVDGTTLNTYGTIPGWNMVSSPFLGPGEDVFVHLSKRRSSTDTATPHVIVKITKESVTTTTVAGSSSYRAACLLDPMLGTGANLLKAAPRYFPDSLGSVYPAVPTLVTARSTGYAVFTLKPRHYSRVGSEVFGGSSYISGGCHTVYDGDRSYDCGFVDIPMLNLAAGSGGGLTGLVDYVAVYKYVGTNGSVTYSRCSTVTPIVLANTKTNVTITATSVTNDDMSDNDRLADGTAVPNIIVELYRTTVGGTQYYLCASSARNAASYPGLSTQAITVSAPYLAVTDSMTDATLVTQPTLFRQPGTPNSPVDRYPPPCGNILCQHKDRLFTTDPHGLRVYYSSFFVDGEIAWYNPAFSFFVHGGSGPITAITSMDGRLFVFKRDGVFVIDGDGPSEGGVTGNEYSPPQKLATSYGCIDHRSVVVTPDGIVYRSTRGIEMLNRSLAVKWVGDKVQNTVNANPFTQGAIIDTIGRVHILVSDTEQTGSVVTGAGVELVWDMTTDSWSTSSYTDEGGTTDVAVQDIVMCDLGGETVLYADPVGGVRYSDDVYSLDRRLYYVPMVIETGWIKTGQQVRARYSKLMALLKASADSNHKMTLSAAFNYVDSYTQVASWEPSALNVMDLEQLELQLKHHEVLAVRFKLEDAEPTNVTLYPVGFGKGPDVLGITLEVAPKVGAAKLGSGQKA